MLERFAIGDYWLSQRAGSAAWYRTWFDPDTRQTARESLRTSDFEAAKLILAEWVTLNATPRNQRPDQTDLATVLARYVTHHGDKLRSAQFARIAANKLVDWFEDATVSDLTLGAQDGFINAMREGGYSDGYTRRIMGVLLAALKRAYNHGELASVPKIKLPEDPPERDRVLSLAECQALWLATEQWHERMFFALAFNTLARPEAILEVTREMADLEHRLLDLHPKGRPITKKFRPTVPISKTLLPWLEQAPPGVLVAWRGKPIASFKTAFRAIRRRAGLDQDVVAKTIRHTMATELRKADVSEAEIQGFLGHRAYRGVTEKYAKWRPNYLGKAVKAIDAYMAKVARLTRS